MSTASVCLGRADDKSRLPNLRYAPSFDSIWDPDLHLWLSLPRHLTIGPGQLLPLCGQSGAYAQRLLQRVASERASYGSGRAPRHGAETGSRPSKSPG